MSLTWQSGDETYALAVQIFRRDQSGFSQCDPSDIVRALDANPREKAEVVRAIDEALGKRLAALIDLEARLGDVPGQRTVLVDGAEASVQAFEPGDLLFAMRAFDAIRQRLWLESMVLSYVNLTRGPVWWLAGVDGWDFVVTAEPSEDLRARAKGITVWKRGEHGRPEKGTGDREHSGRSAPAGSDEAPGAPADAQEPGQGAAPGGRGLQGPPSDGG